MKKILFIHDSLDGGGAERVLIDILRHMDYKQFRVDLALIIGKGVYMEDIPQEVHYLGCIYNKRRGLFKRIIAKLRLNRLYEPFEIKSLIKGNYDTTISFLEGYPARYHSYIMNSASRNVSWIHTDLLVNHRSKGFYINNKEEASIYAKMDKVVFVSQNALDAFRKLFNYSIDNLCVIHNPIDKERITLLSNQMVIEKNSFTFVAVGRIQEQKRYDRLLEAVKLLKERGCRFCLNILGTGTLEEDIKGLSIRLDIDDVINFVGFVSNPYPYIKGADVFVLSSDSEGFPTVVCEAMTLGVPVIGTNVTGTRDLIEDSKYGIVTDLTSESIADAMFLLYSDSEKRRYYAKKALERAQILSVESAMQNIYSVI